MAPWQSAELEANGLRLHYTRTGGDRPPLVLAHGFSDDGLCWTPVARALEGDYDVIMVDARGLGQSMGAATALAMAGAHPDVPGAILLEDPPARWLVQPAGAPTDQAWQARM